MKFHYASFLVLSLHHFYGLQDNSLCINHNIRNKECSNFRLLRSKSVCTTHT